MAIPLVDLRAQYVAHKLELDSALHDVIDGASFIKGKAVFEFERNFAAYSEARHAVGVANGTDAVRLAIEAMEFEPDAEIVTVTNTFIATAEAVTQARARVRFADIDRRTWLIDPKSIRDALTPNTAALLPVHLFGTPVDMDSVAAIAHDRGLKVIDDSAQAHGARYKGRRVGSLGDVSTFSFYPGKNLGAFGDAGAVTTNSDDVDERIRLLADHGRLEKYEHLVEGWNSRLDTVHAAVLDAKLRHLDQWNASRRRIADQYSELLADVPEVEIPEVTAGAEPVRHLYVIAVEERDRLRQHLAEQGIATGIHYPIPLHLQPAYRHLGYARGDFPVAEWLAPRILSLPIYPELPDDQVAFVAGAVRSFFGRS